MWVFVFKAGDATESVSSSDEMDCISYGINLLSWLELITYEVLGK